MRNPSNTDTDLVRVWQAIETVVDPEIPALTVVEMGMIPDVFIRDGAVNIEISPTFAGCPALDLIRNTVANAVRDAGFERVEVRAVFDPPWSTDRITEEGRRKLKAFGLAPPTDCRHTGVSE